MNLNYFNFKKINDSVLLTNDFGNYVLVSEEEFKSIISRDFSLDSNLGKKLLSNNMVFEEDFFSYSATKKYNIRDSKGYANMATSLHIFVVTTACNLSCVYCQANNGKTKPNSFMNQDIAQKSVNVALQSPEKYLTFEFQGGEPLLNYSIVKYIIEYTEMVKKDKVINYNLVSNLTMLTDEMLEFFAEHNVGISTSIDGPEMLHNHNRRYTNGDGTYKDVISKIEKVRDKGIYIGAIETTTRYSLKYPREIVQAYSDMGFQSLFIRPLTRLGKATVNWNDIGYSAEEFIDFYKQALDELISINLHGRFIKEDHASIMLKKMNGTFVNYMELRSPCGAGIGQLAYYSDGNIFTCDEGRMFYEMGDDSFLLGNVFANSYNDIISNGKCRTVCASSILETIPSCCDCVYQPYCGICPVVNLANNKDLLEKHPREYRCKIFGGILDTIFTLIQNDNKEVINILNSWSE